MLKLLGYCGYYLSMLIWYAFFATIAAGHFFFYFNQNPGFCFAYSQKSLTEAFPSGGDNLHDVSTNFKLVNMWGGITFALITLLLMIAHFSLWRDRYGAEWIICPAVVLAINWVGYFLCLMSVRLRHAGKVCSGDYLPNRLLFNENLSPYIHNSGLFLWYAIIA